MEHKCVVCHDHPQRFRCIQCHKSVCNECAFKTEHGAFCARECAAAYRDYMKARPSPKRSSETAKLLVWLLIVSALVIAVAYLLGLL